MVVGRNNFLLKTQSSICLRDLETQDLGDFIFGSGARDGISPGPRTSALLSRSHLGQREWTRETEATRLPWSAGLSIFEEIPDEAIHIYGCTYPEWRLTRLGTHLKAIIGDHSGSRLSELPNTDIVARACMMIKMARDTGTDVFSRSTYTDCLGRLVLLETRFFDLSGACKPMAVVGSHHRIRIVKRGETAPAKYS